MRGILGIDPGLNGGVAIRGDEIKLSAIAMPLIDGKLNLVELKSWLIENRHGFDKAYIEQVHAIFGSSAKNTFEFGRICGQLEALLSAMSIPFQFVTPKVWQVEFFSLGGKLDPKQRKERCILTAQRLWPEFDLRENTRCRTPHTGITDSALIAEYGWRKEKER